MTPKDFDNLSNKTAPFAFDIIDTINKGIAQARLVGLDRTTTLHKGFIFAIEAIAVLEEEEFYKRGGTPAEIAQKFDEFCAVRIAEENANGTIEELINKSYGGTD